MRYLFPLCSLLVLMLLISPAANAQFFKKLADEVTERVERKIINDAGDAAVKGVDEAENVVGEAVSSTASGGTEGSDRNVPAGTPDRAGEDKQHTVAPGRDNVNANYDFVPGEHTIFYIDFTKEQIGNFPRRLEFINGNLDVVKWNEERFGRVKGQTRFAISLPEQLPEKFTIQLKLHDTYWLGHVHLATTEAVAKGETYFSLYNRRGVGVVTKEGPSSTGSHKAIEEKAVPIEIMVDGKYAKMYVNGVRVANIPQVNIKRTDKLYFDFRVSKDEPEEFGYITDIRIAGGGRTLYQKLEADGRIAIHDIHFATGRATILPESAETIKTIAVLLHDHPDLRVLIEGHTDNVGDFEDNMQLSKARADAVKSHLVQQHQISADRLQTMGMGESRPSASNETEEGRAENRRVEIAKL